jgi:hypothetical protein
MATDRLKIYNGALQNCKLRSIASLTVNEESRRELDTVWNDGGVRYCLEQGQWLFARRTSKFTYDTAIEPQFGYRYAFAKPSDWVNTAGIASDEYFNCPLNQFNDEAGYWYADLTEIYVRYTSDDTNYGMDMAKWPNSFTEYVKMYFASKVVGKLTSDTARETAILEPRRGLLAVALNIAQNRDTQSEPAKFLPQGQWSRSRMRGATGDWRDGGNRNRLIG